LPTLPTAATTRFVAFGGEVLVGGGPITPVTPLPSSASYRGRRPGTISARHRDVVAIDSRPRYARGMLSPDLHPLPLGYTVRPVADDDLEDVVRLMDDADRALGLGPDQVREYLTWVWHLSSTDLERDTRLVEHGTQPACFAQATWDPDEGGPFNVLIRVHPDHLARGLGSWALAWAETLAAERDVDGVRARATDRDAAAHELLSSRGYIQVRASWTMGKALEPDEDAGTTPAGVHIRTFETGRDERTLHEVTEASFADHWGFRPVPYETYEAGMYGAEAWDPSLAYLAEVDGQVVGHLVALSFEGEAYIAELGVVPNYRGRGIAKALLRRSFAALEGRGHDEVRLGVDAQNPTGAVALYESVGMTPLRMYDVFDLGTADAERAMARRATRTPEA
jgi:mycothiol synthase